jgi:hypothetical protein
VVIDLDVVTCGSGSNKTTCYHPVVRFVTAREQVIEFTSNVDAGYRVGDAVKVRYDPDNPRHARLDSAWARLVSGFFDVVFLLVGLAVMLGGGYCSGGKSGGCGGRRKANARHVGGRRQHRN